MAKSMLEVAQDLMEALVIAEAALRQHVREEDNDLTHIRMTIVMAKISNPTVFKS